MKCEVERCANPGDFRIFQFREDETNFHLELCERHVRPIIARYSRECAQTPRPTGASLLPFNVACIATRDGSDMAVVYLRAAGGPRFVFTTGTLEGWMLLRTLPGGTEGSLTVKSMAAVIDGLGGELREVVIDQLEKDAYRATLRFVQAGRPLPIEVRASEGVALALATGAPIHIASELLSHSAERALQIDVVERMKLAGPMLGAAKGDRAKQTFGEEVGT
ncbi:MAG TPA: bifunctional nuclease domain-containing protein [Pirellulales bacterium]|nr:bifunctional nuclease domain-containing protein [Pirellulales bacterium]